MAAACFSQIFLTTFRSRSAVRLWPATRRRGGGADLVKDPQSTLTVNYSLIGTGITPTTGGNNMSTNDPQLGLLANNGGPTQTHAPLAGSPAIDAGFCSTRPSSTSGRPLRAGLRWRRPGGGADRHRRLRSAVIIVPPDLLGDYNLNEVVDAADYVVWRKTLGTSVAPPFRPRWRRRLVRRPGRLRCVAAHFGQTLPPGAGSAPLAHCHRTSGSTGRGRISGTLRDAAFRKHTYTALGVSLAVFEDRSTRHDMAFRLGDLTCANRRVSG